MVMQVVFKSIFAFIMQKSSKVQNKVCIEFATVMFEAYLHIDMHERYEL